MDKSIVCCLLSTPALGLPLDSSSLSCSCMRAVAACVSPPTDHLTPHLWLGGLGRSSVCAARLGRRRSMSKVLLMLRSNPSGGSSFPVRMEPCLYCWHRYPYLTVFRFARTGPYLFVAASGPAHEYKTSHVSVLAKAGQAPRPRACG